MSGSAHAGTTLFFITTHVWSPNQGQKKRGCTLTPWWLPCTMHMHGASPLPLYFPPGAPPECSPQAKTHAVSAHRRCCRGPAPPQQAEIFTSLVLCFLATSLRSQTITLSKDSRFNYNTYETTPLLQFPLQDTTWSWPRRPARTRRSTTAWSYAKGGTVRQLRLLVVSSTQLSSFYG